MANDPAQELEQLKQELISVKKTLDEAKEANERNFIDSITHKLASVPNTNATPGLLEELEEKAASITSDHPRLSGILREIADTLGKLGI